MATGNFEMRDQDAAYAHAVMAEVEAMDEMLDAALAFDAWVEAMEANDAEQQGISIDQAFAAGYWA